MGTTLSNLWPRSGMETNPGEQKRILPFNYHLQLAVRNAIPATDPENSKSNERCLAMESCQTWSLIDSKRKQSWSQRVFCSILFHVALVPSHHCGEGAHRTGHVWDRCVPSQSEIYRWQPPYTLNHTHSRAPSVAVMCLPVPPLKVHRCLPR